MHLMVRRHGSLILNRFGLRRQQKVPFSGCCSTTSPSDTQAVCCQYFNKIPWACQLGASSGQVTIVPRPANVWCHTFSNSISLWRPLFPYTIELVKIKTTTEHHWILLPWSSSITLSISLAIPVLVPYWYTCSMFIFVRYLRLFWLICTATVSSQISHNTWKPCNFFRYMRQTCFRTLPTSYIALHVTAAQSHYIFPTMFFFVNNVGFLYKNIIQTCPSLPRRA